MPDDEGTDGTGGLLPYPGDELRHAANSRRVLAAQAREEAREDDARAALARLDAADDGRPLLRPRYLAPDRSPFTAPEAEGESAFNVHLDDRDYAAAVREAGMPAGELTGDDELDLRRMRPQPWDAPAEQPREEEAEETGWHGQLSGGGGGVAATAGVGHTEEGGGTSHVTVGLDGAIDAELAVGEHGGVGVNYDPREHRGHVRGRVGDDDGSHASLQVGFENGRLGQTEVEGQLGRSSGSHVRAGVNLDRRGRVTRAELSGRVRGSGPRKSLVGGKVVYQATYGEPTSNPATGQYDVTVDLAITVDLSAGGRIRSGAELRGNFGGDTRQRVVRHFASQAEAQAWCDGDQPELDGAVMNMLRGRLAPEDAEALGIGTEVEITQGGHGGGRIELAIATLEVKLRTSSTLVYQRVDDHTFRVGHRTERGVEVAPGLETPILGASRSSDHAWRNGRVVEFDLSTPAGQAALDAALARGALPGGARGSGWRVVETSEGTTVTDQTTINALGSRGTIRGSTTVDVVTDEHGDRDVRAQGDHSVTGADNELDFLDLADDAGTTRTHIDLDDRGARLREDVQAEDAMSSQQALAAATGTEWHMGHGERPGAGGARSGDQWRAQVSLSDQQMRTVWSRLGRGDGRRFAHILATQANEVDTLAAAAASAASAEALRPAVAAFITATGAKGSQFLRALAGGSADYDLTLEGSTVFEGAAGRARFAASVEALEQRVAADPGDPALLPDARALLRDQQTRVSQMADVDAFSLPPAVRRHELDANQPLLARIRRLVANLERGERHIATAAARSRSAEEVAGDEQGMVESNAETHAAGQALETRSHGALAAFRGDEQRMLTARSRAVRLKAAVQAEGRIHHTPSPGNGIPPIELFTGIGGHHDGDYAAAHRATREADAILAEARTFYGEYEDLRARVPADGVLDGATRAIVEEIRRTCWALATSYQRAFALLEQARQRYVAIRADHDDVRFWGRTHAPAAVD